MNFELNERSEEIIYPKSILDTFQVQNIPDFILDILEYYKNIDKELELILENIEKMVEINNDIIKCNQDLISKAFDGINSRKDLNNNFRKELDEYIDLNIEAFLKEVNNIQDDSNNINKKIIEQISTNKVNDKDIIKINNELESESFKINRKKYLYKLTRNIKKNNNIKTNKIKKVKLSDIDKTKFKESLFDIYDKNILLVEEIKNLIEWEEKNLGNGKSDNTVENFFDIFSKCNKYNKYFESNSDDFNFKFNSLLIKKIILDLMYEVLLNKEENNLETVSALFLFLELNDGDNINLINESLKYLINIPKIPEGLLINLKKSYLFKYLLKIRKNDNYKILFEIFISKPNLFLSEEKIKYENLFNYILKQDNIKLDKIYFFLNKYFRKEYSENDLIFIFKNNLEEFDIIIKQNNIENIIKIKELNESGFDINSLEKIKNADFSKIFPYYKSGELNIKELKYYLENNDKIISFLKNKNLKKEIEKYIIYYEKKSDKYKELCNFLSLKDNEIDGINLEELIDKNFIKKIDNILGKSNVKENINDYYFLLEKINILESKAKDKRIKKQERIDKNNFLTDFFKNNSEDEIKLILNILKKVNIASDNTFENIKENIKIIINYKTLAEKELSENNFDKEYFRDISSYLNSNNQKKFYNEEFIKLGINEDLVNGIIEKYTLDNSLKLLLHIGESINGNEVDDIFILLDEKKVEDSKLKIIINFISFTSNLNLNYGDIIEPIEDIIKLENFNYIEEKEKINFLRIQLSNYNIENGNSNIKFLALDYLKGIITKDKFLRKINEGNFHKISLNLNNDFDKKLFKVLEEKDESNIEKIILKINNYFDIFFKEFNSSNTSSTTYSNFGKGSGSYTRLLNTILRTLRQGDNENNIEYLNRIKAINFNNFYSNDIYITNKRIQNIIGNAQNNKLPFYESLEKFGENVIQKINTHGNEDLTKLNKFYSEIFKKNKKILEL